MFIVERDLNMRMTESRLRSIIRNIIAEGGMTVEDYFNKEYCDLMLESGSDSDHYGISEKNVRSMDHYGMINNACKQGYTSYGNIDEIEAAEIFQKIGCECEYFGGSWFSENAKKLIECLKKTQVEERKIFFGEMDALLHH